MTVTTTRPYGAPAIPPARRYLRPPIPKHFPVEEEMPETRRHVELRTALFWTIQREFGDRAVVGTEQFVYWDPSDPQKCCAPDLMVRVGEPDARFDSWKVWERGAPHVAVEIISASDASDRPWDSKLDRYRRLGVRELLRFDADDAERPLRIWDHVDGDLVERDPADPSFTRCDALEAYWCVGKDRYGERTLRLSRDVGGTSLYPTSEEAIARAAEATQREADATQRAAEATQREVEARKLADLRVRELEAELAKHRER
jgi:hypothetical protein